MMTQGHLRLHRQNNDEYRKRLMHDNLGILACVLWDVLVLTVFCEVFANTDIAILYGLRQSML
jgi:hypothetical protein